MFLLSFIDILADTHILTRGELKGEEMKGGCNVSQHAWKNLNAERKCSICVLDMYPVVP